MNILTSLLFGFQSSGHGNIDISYVQPDNEQVAMIGKIGHTITPLKLCGFVEINGKRYEAMSTSISMKKNVPVKVVGQSFGLLKVEPLTGEAGQA